MLVEPGELLVYEWVVVAVVESVVEAALEISASSMRRALLLWLSLSMLSLTSLYPDRSRLDRFRCRLCLAVERMAPFLATTSFDDLMLSCCCLYRSSRSLFVGISVVVVGLTISMRSTPIPYHSIIYEILYSFDFRYLSVIRLSLNC